MNYFNPCSTYYGMPQYGYQQPMYQQPQVIQQNVIGGKIVDGIDTIKGFDVPIGTTYYFPQADGKKVFSKGWRNDGTTFLNEYDVITPTEEIVPDPYEEKLNSIYEYIEKLDKKFDDYKPKKRLVEVDADE